MIECGSGLIVPRAPRCAAIHGDNRALIGHQQHDVAVVGIDPIALIVVAAGRAAMCRPRLAGVGGLPGDRVGGVHDVWISGIDGRCRHIIGLASDVGVRGRYRPTLTGVLGAIHGPAARRLHNRVDAIGVARCDRDANATQSVGGCGKALREWLP